MVASRARRSGVMWMAAGTVAIGLSGFVFLSVVGRGRMDPATAAALASVFLLSNVLGPGVFVAVEQETSRRVSRRPGGGSSGTGPATAVLGALTLAVLAVAGEVVLEPVFRGDVGLVLALAVCVVGSTVVFHGRGVLGGQRRFRRYGVGLLVDAGVRITGVAVLTLAGTTSGVAFALAWCAGPGVAALTTRPRGPAGGGDSRGVPAAVGSLLVASLVSMAVANLSPVLVAAALPAEPSRAFAFACALVLTRAPLLFIGPIQAMLLPGLVTAAARGDTADVRRQLHRGLQIVAGLGVAAVAGAWLVGRPVLILLFGRDADLLPAAVIAALAAAAVLMVAVSVTQLSMVALGSHRLLLFGWTGGAVAFIAVFAAAVHTDPVGAGVAATLAAPAVTLATLLAGTHRHY